MAEIIQIPSTSDNAFHFAALHAQPAGHPHAHRRGGVIVLQEIFGLDRYVAEDVVRWSHLGFEAVAPSLFDRVKPGFLVEHDAAGLAEGVELMKQTSTEDVLSDIAACIDFLAPRGPVFLVGYCYGGSMGWQAAAKLEGLSAVSSYYGGMIAHALELEPLCPIICHFGRNDQHIPADTIQAVIHSHHPEVPVYIYENSGHGFNNEGRPDSNTEDAALARQRTLALFEKHGAK